MNYLSRSSTFDEDKEPYEIVIEKNMRSRAKRAQDDTKEELSKVLSRVENVSSGSQDSSSESLFSKVLPHCSTFRVASLRCLYGSRLSRVKVD